MPSHSSQAAILLPETGESYGSLPLTLTAETLTESRFIQPPCPGMQPKLSDIGVIITDHHPKIRYVNQAFTMLTGYSLREVKGRNPSILQSGYYDQRFYQNL